MKILLERFSKEGLGRETCPKQSRRMKKYLSIFKISFQQEFAYPINFIMWRVRNIMGVFLVFFLWEAIFVDPQRVIFGYDKAKILTYVFATIFMRAIVISSKTVNVTGDISDGKLSNYLLKPMNFFKYWFSRDAASKVLNLIFSIGEFLLLYLILRPPFFWQESLSNIGLFVASLVLAVVLFFLLILLISSIPLWVPEQSWAPVFLFFTIIEFLCGGTFPIDVLPQAIQNILYLTPFPYLIFVPIQVYLGKWEALMVGKWFLISIVWVVILSIAVKNVWALGLKSYKSEGR